MNLIHFRLLKKNTNLSIFFYYRTSTVDKKYEKKIAEFQKAIEYGSTGQCPSEYNCKKENIERFLRT